MVNIYIYIWLIYMVNISLIFSEIFDVINHRAIGIIYICIYIYMRVSINGGTPIAGWVIVENPIKIDDLGLYTLVN